jgi:all-trans-8'-apo-beta-carotenal 15,15'-oxygenase
MLGQTVLEHEVADYAPRIENAFTLEPRELCYTVKNIEGRIPAFIRGAYYLNGPARFESSGVAYRHWLDGDGMICALRFEKDRVMFTNRFVRSHKFVAEANAGGPLFRTFGTAFPGDLLKRKVMIESPVNVSVYRYGNSLLAFGEQGLPYELDPSTLETLGEFNFGGALNDVSPFSAHPKFDRETGEMFNFGIAFSATEPLLHFYRFDAHGALVYRRRLKLGYPCSLHDFGLSQSYAIFYLSPYLLNMHSLVLEGRTLMDSLEWHAERGSRLLVVSRQTGAVVASVPAGSRHCLHFINCFEGGGLLNVDVLELERPIYDQYQTIPNLFSDVCEGQPVRYVIGATAGEVCERRAIEYRCAPDFPSIDLHLVSRAYEEFWMLGISSTGQFGRKFFDQLVHASWNSDSPSDIYHAPPEHYLGGEPIFIPDPSGKTSGSIICQLFDARRVESSFAIFDAANVSAGPVTRLRLETPIHLGFHATFVEANQLISHATAQRRKESP